MAILGIALPKWIVSKEYDICVFATYGFLFLIILPAVVVSSSLYSALRQMLPSPQGNWWYNLIKCKCESMVINIQRLRWREFLRVSSINMSSALLCLLPFEVFILEELIQLLSASLEFSNEYTSK